VTSGRRRKQCQASAALRPLAAVAVPKRGRPVSHGLRGQPHPPPRPPYEPRSCSPQGRACGRHALPFRRDQLATVTRAVETCTEASAKRTPRLKKGDQAGAEDAAIAARNLCSSSRAAIVAAVGIGGPLDACYPSVDRQEAVQQAESHALDSATPDNLRRVVATLDEAISQQNSCSIAINGMTSEEH
jgi:hypothetical protein